ncbi:hypothetical protein [Crocosphaera chwakensis]|uniref:Uncharacterized protein n=1 Tax=Crocosphaera chwakensis CCY0110 TaxID=391612 RepID=A3IXD3_9CHRO|nr:hypothetical protein [Crocosphaera chwakensis]EAZ88876.1 hypothetical protein CY0110_31320 [Crocosphaera chwakensis CCY0110]
MTQLLDKTNPDKVLNLALKSLTFSFDGTRFVGKVEPTPIIEWLFTESPFIVALDDDKESGQIEIRLEGSSYLLISWGFNVDVFDVDDGRETEAFYHYCLS